MSNIEYTAPKTCAQFMKSDKLVRVIAGPIGSGKTTACIFELFRKACEQKPAPDGVRYTRFAIVRQTLAQLKLTILKDILTWFKDIADYRVSENTVYIRIGDVHSEWILVPLEDPADQKRLLSSQLTGAWMSECIEMDATLVGPLLGRCGRFPSGVKGYCTWRGVIADTNMPTSGSDWHRLMDLNTPDTWGIYIQPGGMEPDAENLEWLLLTEETAKMKEDDPRRRESGRRYYSDLMQGHSEGFIQRYVHAQYGDDPSGTAVYKGCFDRSVHVVDGLEPSHGHILMVGQDFGRDPCAVVCQVDHRGRLLILDEIISEDMGLEIHVDRCLRPRLMHERYFGRAVAVIGDPAGRAKSSISEETSFDCLARMGFKAFPAPTNDIDPRIRAVEAWLVKRDGILIDGSRCPTLVRALGGGYRYGKTKAGQRKPTPDKNNYSHIIDALQYVCMVAHGRMGELVAQHLRYRTYTKAAPPPVQAWT